MGMAGMFAYIVGSPYAFIEHFHLTTGQFGLIFAVNALGLVLAALECAARPPFYERRDHQEGARASSRLRYCSLCGDAQWASSALRNCNSAFVYVSSVGCLFPNVTAMAMAPHGARAGSASALIGVLQFALAAGSASLIGAANSGSALPVASLMGICAVAAAFIYRTMVAGAATKRALSGAG
jgi:DHA1 family bicyclomycin/chloramphenicol resistance-like MFS transporter